MSMWLYIRKFTHDDWNLKKATNNNDKAFEALLTNLSEAFVCWSDDLLITNFHANGLDLLSRT